MTKTVEEEKRNGQKGLNNRRTRTEKERSLSRNQVMIKFCLLTTILPMACAIFVTARQSFAA